MGTSSVGRTLRRIAWVMVAAMIALGGAGLVAGASLPPTARPELTVRGDARMAPGLAALDAGLTAVDGHLGQLVGTGEQVLVDLTGMTSGTVASAQISTDLQQGDDQLLALDEQAQALQATYAPACPMTPRPITSAGAPRAAWRRSGRRSTSCRP